MTKKTTLKLTLPFYPERVLKVLKAITESKGSKNQVMRNLEDGGWYTRMAQTYFNYCKHWQLSTVSDEKCGLTPLGKSVLHLTNSGLNDMATELIYYGFASSKEFDTLGIIVKKLFSRLEKYGPFRSTNRDISSRFVPEFKERRDISDLTNIFHRVKLFERERQKGKLVYYVNHYDPKIGSFSISLFHYIRTNQLNPPHNIDAFNEFRAYWFVSKSNFIKYLRRFRAIGLISYQEYADVNQFQFIIKDISKLTKRVIKLKEKSL